MVGTVEGAEDIEEDILDREYHELSYVDSYRSGNKE